MKILFLVLKSPDEASDTYLILTLNMILQIWGFVLNINQP